MKKLVLFVLLCVQVVGGVSQQITFIKAWQSPTQVSLYVSNTNYCPYQCTIFWEDSVQVQQSFLDEKNHFIIPPQTNRYLLLTVNWADTSKKEFNYRSSCYLGDLQNEPDTQFVYFLPFKAGETFRLIQGYMGKFSHRNQFALDFKMKTGTPICAARGGVVVKVKEDSNKGGGRKKFSDFANHIIIYHSDGSMANYFHLQQNGSLVEVGDTVQIGQVIGYSGNTGWSTTPHLHFVVKKAIFMDYQTIPTYFWIGENQHRRLKAHRKYIAFHPQL